MHLIIHVWLTTIDIDECIRSTDNCDTNAVCTNTHGSFTCTCQSGYAGNGVTCNGKLLSEIRHVDLLFLNLMIKLVWFSRY